MKAASLLRHIWVGGFICFLFLAGTGVAYANATTNEFPGDKAEPAAKKEVVVKGEEPPVKKMNVAPASAAPVAKQGKVVPKQPEVKKEEASTAYFSFSFLYYLFYKNNFAETTNQALRTSIKSLISRMLD